MGKSFVRELSHLFLAYAEGTALESIALRAAMTMPMLLLQKPHRTSKSKDHVSCLERRMQLWKDGALSDLLLEGRTIQDRLNMSTKQESDDVKMKRIFLREMSKGNVKGALHAISSNNPGRVYHLNDVVSTNLETTTTVLDTLKAKHPPRHQLATETLVEGIDNPPFVHPVIFDCIQGQTIRSAALRTNGAAGPSGIDALGWKRMCTSFNSASEDLCNSLALLARRLCTVFLDPSGLAPLLSCRLIALDKKPGVHPIGICETVRRIITKAFLSVVGSDIQDAAGSIQLCAGQKAGIETAVHAMKMAFKDIDSEAVLMIDASNAFNSLNRESALRKFFVPPSPPSSSTPIAVIHSYLQKVQLYIHVKVQRREIP